MAHLLDGAWARIERAEESIRYLDTEAKQFFASDPAPYRIERVVEDDGRRYVWKAFAQREPPLRLAVIAGEVVQHLRSSLDYVVTALVQSRSNTVRRNHHFPICRTAEKFKEACNRRAIEGVSASSARLIESLQPYQGGDDPEGARITVLHDLNNGEKHSLLTVVVASVIIGQAQVQLTPGRPQRWSQGIWFAPRRITQDGEVIGDVTYDGVTPEKEPNLKFAAHIAFEQFGPLKCAPVVEELSKSAYHIREIVDAFLGEFPAP